MLVEQRDSKRLLASIRSRVQTVLRIDSPAWISATRRSGVAFSTATTATGVDTCRRLLIVREPLRWKICHSLQIASTTSATASPRPGAADAGSPTTSRAPDSHHAKVSFYGKAARLQIRQKFARFSASRGVAVGVCQQLDSREPAEERATALQRD